ncbi:MAG: MFS transporter [Polyangia bacterium]
MTELQDPASAKGPPRTLASLLVVYMTVFLDLLGFGLILPLLPFYAMRFGAHGAQIGLLFACFSIAQLFGAPVLGRLSDRLGRRPVLLLCLMGSTLSLLATGLTDSLYTLMAARALAGLFGGSIATAQAYVADVTTPAERTKYMGLIGASIGMGFVFGPFVGAELSRFGFSTAAFVAAGLSCANLILAVFSLHESLPESARGKSQRVTLSVSSLHAALTRKVVGPLLLITMLATLAFVAMESTFALFAKLRYGFSEQTMGRLFALIGIVIAIIQGGVIGPLARRFGEVSVGIAGFLILTVSFAALPFMPTQTLTITALVVVAVGQGLLNPSLSTLLSRAASKSEQGGTLGLGQSLNSLSRAVGPVLAGTLFDFSPPLPYLLAAMITIGLAILLARHGRAAQT